MLALPLVLGVLLGAAKWKQLHPTATQFDLTERAHMRKAKIVNLVYKGNYISIPVDEFKATLDEFYLMDKSSSRAFLSSSQIPATQTTIVIRKDKDKSMPLAEIDLDAPVSYLTFTQNGTGPVVPLHPVTVRRLRELIAKYASSN